MGRHHSCDMFGHTRARAMRRGFLHRPDPRRVARRIYACAGDSSIESFARGADAPTTDVFFVKVLRHLNEIELLMLTMTSRTMRACVRDFLDDDDEWNDLHKVKLFAGREVQMDYSETRDIERAREDATLELAIDPRERFWLRASRGEFARWGLVFTTQTMIDCVKNPPRVRGELQPRGDHDVRHRIIYLRDVLKCPWDDDALVNILIDKEYFYTLNWCLDNGCAWTPRERLPFCLAERFNTTEEEFERFVTTSMLPDIDEWHIDSSHGFDVVVGTQNPPPEPEKEIIPEEEFDVRDLTKVVGEVDPHDMRFLTELGFFK